MRLESHGLLALLVSVLAQIAHGQDLSAATNAPEQIASLKASNAFNQNYFGMSVAISGDVLLVGAHGENSTSTGVNGHQGNGGSWASGAAYAFRGEGDRWLQEAFLKPSTNRITGQFGISCSLWEDTAAIGSSELGDKGSAYVFVRTGRTWKEQAQLRPRPEARNDQFGAAVAIAKNIIVVGAPQDRSLAKGVDGDANDNSDISVGAAYVFEKTTKGWQQQAYLKPSNSRGGFKFGEAVAVSGETIVVGASGEDSLGKGVGADQAPRRTTGLELPSRSQGPCLRSGRVMRVPRKKTPVRPGNLTPSRNPGRHTFFGFEKTETGDPRRYITCSTQESLDERPVTQMSAGSRN